ncbi:MAG: hypothetical protein ABJN62_12155 [Halioglobus sp.]
MSLIESLRNEVEIRESEHAAILAEREAQQTYYEDSLKPSMQEARSYFLEVVRNLKFLKTVTPVSLPMAPDGESLVAMEQSGYEFFYDNANNPMRLDIVCECLVSGAQRFYLSTPDKVAQYTEFLDGLHFSYHRKTELDSKYEIRNATFELEGPLKVGVTIEASLADRCIYIYMRNVEGLAKKRYRFAPEKVDTALMERLARLILRQEETLVNVTLPNEVRNELSMQVMAERQEREKDLKIAIEEMRLERLAEVEARKLSTKVKNLTQLMKSKMSDNLASA